MNNNTINSNLRISNESVLLLPDGEIPKIAKQDKPYEPLLRYVLDTIKLNPSHHDQETWRCGTSFCFAGFTDLIARSVLDQEEILLEQDFEDTETSLCVNTALGQSLHNNNLDNDLTTEALAIAVLGLDYFQADELFSPGNSLEKIETYINELVG